MSLPIRTFWFMNSCIDRVRAEQDMRALTVASHAQSSEGVQSVREHLTMELGEVMKVDPIKAAIRDEGAAQKLKALSKVT